jgi:hypothetical protein
VAVIVFILSLGMALLQAPSVPPEQRLLGLGSMLLAAGISGWGIFTAFALLKLALDVRALRREQPP